MPHDHTCQEGCCICRLRKSTSNFVASRAYESSFEVCFGEKAKGRTGKICNPCVLLIKRSIGKSQKRSRHWHMYVDCCLNGGSRQKTKKEIERILQAEKKGTEIKQNEKSIRICDEEMELDESSEEQEPLRRKPSYLRLSKLQEEKTGVEQVSSRASSLSPVDSLPSTSGSRTGSCLQNLASVISSLSNAADMMRRFAPKRIYPGASNEGTTYDTQPGQNLWQRWRNLPNNWMMLIETTATFEKCSLFRRRETTSDNPDYVLDGPLHVFVNDKEQTTADDHERDIAADPRSGFVRPNYISF